MRNVVISIAVLGLMACSGPNGSKAGGQRLARPTADDGPRARRPSANSSARRARASGKASPASGEAQKCRQLLGKRICERIYGYRERVFAFLFRAKRFLETVETPISKKLLQLGKTERHLQKLLHAYSCVQVANTLNECSPETKKKLQVSPMSFVRGCRLNVAMAYRQLGSRGQRPNRIVVVWISGHVCALAAGDDCQELMGCFHKNDPSYFYAVTTNQPTVGLKSFQHLPPAYHLSTPRKDRNSREKALPRPAKP